jgi:SAM-dependent methyltransferase
MDDGELYSMDYATSTYGDQDGIVKAFTRIRELPANRSDNSGRVERVLSFAKEFFPAGHFSTRAPRVLDVGSGLGVFLDRMRKAGWNCTAVDIDRRFVEHARNVIGVHAVPSFDEAALERYELVACKQALENPGVVYLELPDGETASVHGPGREEFFIEHHHIFSMSSLSVLASEAGLKVRLAERLHEPSGKFTLAAFLVL